MGSGYKDFSAGNVLEEADLDGFLMRQTQMCFASTAARDSALSGVLAQGMRAYTEDNDREWVYDGSNWWIVSEPWQSWSATITQSGTPTKTTNRARFKRTREEFVAIGDWSFTSAGTASNAIVISLPVTLQDSVDLGGDFIFIDSGSNIRAGEVGPLSTTTCQLFVDDAGTNPFGVAPAITIVNGDRLRVRIYGSVSSSSQS